MGLMAAMPVERYTVLIIAFLLIAMLKALRTRTSSNGFFCVL